MLLICIFFSKNLQLRRKVHQSCIQSHCSPECILQRKLLSTMKNNHVRALKMTFLSRDKLPNFIYSFCSIKIQQQLPKIMEQVDCPSHTHILVRPWTYCSQREGTPTYFREGSSQAWYDVLLHKQSHWSAIIQEQQDTVELPVIQLFSILKDQLCLFGLKDNFKENILNSKTYF